MRLLSSLVGIVLMCLSAASGGRPPAPDTLTPADLLAEYDRLGPINASLQSGRMVAGEYPRSLGTFHSRPVEEVYSCGGDLCPQNSSVKIVYKDISEQDCVSLGQPLYSFGWGAHYRGCSPLFATDGHLAIDEASWSLVYDTLAREAVHTPLVFDVNSACSSLGIARTAKDTASIEMLIHKWATGTPDYGESIPCTALKVGQWVLVQGISNGASVMVLRVEIYGDSRTHL